MFKPCITLAIFISTYCFGSIELNQLSLEEKVGQLLMVHFHGTVANEDAKSLIQEVKVGGIIYYNWSNELSSPKQVARLSTSLQNLAQENHNPIPLLIATDQEGGLVNRLNQGFTIFPGNKALGMVADPNLAFLAAKAMGEELRSVGVSMCLAPVVDVNSNPRNPVIGIRSYSDDPLLVSEFGKKALEGYQQAHIITTLKHFPGHGDVIIDSHEDLPTVNKSINELVKTELLPFGKLADFADTIMTAHILVPALDKENCVTLSEKALTFLRKKLNFQGAIISDSLVMQGVLKKCHSVDEAAIQAFNAGCDILLLGGQHLVEGHPHLELTVTDIKRIHGTLVQAVKEGQISEFRLNQAVEKILKLKKSFLHKPNDEKELDFNAVILTKDHQEVAQKIASLAIKKIENAPLLFKDWNQKILIVAPRILHAAIKETFDKMGQSIEFVFFSELNPSLAEIKEMMTQAERADAFIICSYNAWKNQSQIALIQELLETKKPTILLVTRDPIDASLFPKANLIFQMFSPTIVSFEAVCDLLVENIENSIHCYYKKGNQMKPLSELSKKSCIPCKGGIPPLKGEKLQTLISQLKTGWDVMNEHHLEKTYTFPDFRSALEFTNKVGELAESEQHHPDILLSYGKVKVTIWTHKIDGLTESDFILAAKCDELI